MAYEFTEKDIQIIREMRKEIDRLLRIVDALGGGSSAPGQRRNPPPRFFPVRLTQTGGSAGNKTTECTYTYTVKDINNGATLGTAIAVAGHAGRVVNAACGTSAQYGLAFYNETGVLKILWCDERFSQTNCT